jgi:hypothetical protein
LRNIFFFPRQTGEVISDDVTVFVGVVEICFYRCKLLLKKERFLQNRQENLSSLEDYKTDNQHEMFSIPCREHAPIYVDIQGF